MASDAVATFGDLLRRARLAASLSQEDLAARAGLSSRGISDLERGINRTPRRDTLDLLAVALDLSADERRQWERVRQQFASPATSAPAAISKTPNRPTAGLPARLTTFIGRANEIEQLCALLSQPEIRLVTLLGPGGIGKTRLALAAAERLADAFLDRIAFVPLAAIRDPDLVPAAIGSAFDVRETDPHTLVARIATEIGERRVLLVLDNVEQVLDAASVVSELLVACSELTVLVTSRAVLRLTGEHNVPLAPLALANAEQLPSFERLIEIESIQLFVERARSARADFCLTQANAPTIGAICARLDGLPLAIELAAAWVRLLSPPDLLAQLDHRLQLLAGGPRDQPVRLRTMRDTIAWSYDLLDPDKRRLFNQLAAFAGGWILAAAEAICGDDTDVLSGLGVLIDQSLVQQVEQPDGSTRFGMLETVREFGLERLDASEMESAVRRRHAAYFLALAEAGGPHLDGRDQALWLNRLVSDHANLSAALRWLNQEDEAALALRMVTALGQYWFSRGQLGEAITLIDATLALPGAAEPSVARAGALKTASWIVFWSGAPVRAAALAEEGLAILRAADEPSGMPYLLTCLGLAAGTQMDLDRARAAFEACVPLAREQGDMTSLARALSNLGAMAAYHFGDYREALRLTNESLAIARAAQEPGQIALALELLALIVSGSGDDVAARQRFHESLTLYWQLGSQWGIARILESIADIVVGVERAEAAIRLSAAADLMRNRAGIPQWAYEQPAYERRLAKLRAALGPEGFDAAWRAGAALPVADAVREAFVHVAPPGPALQPSNSKDPTAAHGLTPRELEVLQLIAAGLSNRQIADTLFLSPRTIERHIANIYLKIDVHSKAEATAYALRQQLTRG